MNQARHMVRIVVLLWLSLWTLDSRADIDSDIQNLQQRWAQVNYQLNGDARLAGFEELLEAANMSTATYPDSADVWIWSGIIKSTYARAKGGTGALSLAKAAKADLEKAISINPTALSGAAYTTLGALYANVPGWPLGFGNDETAEKMLLKGLALNPDGMDSNYCYGDYLLKDGRYAQARQYLQKAQQAASQPESAIADEGRQQQIATELKTIAERSR